MAFGAFAPLPLRLGGNELTGWTAEQHKRFTCDLAAARRMQASAVFHVAKSGSSVTISSYYGEQGNGPAFHPTATVNGAGDVSLAFTPAVWEDELGADHHVVVRGAMADCTESARQASVQVVDHKTVRLRTFGIPGGAGIDAEALVEVWFDRSPRMGDYGGAVDKEDSKTEGTTPRAWTIYRELQAMRGDAYSKERSGYIHCEHLALARHISWLWWRLPEEAANNRTPSRADALLGYWVKVLDVPNYKGDRDWEIRQRAAVKFRRMTGSARPDIDNAFQSQLGDDLVSIVRTEGASLAAPPDFTYWPAVNPGPSGQNLGGGTWSSHRSHLFFVLSRSFLADKARLQRLVNGALFRLADDILPAWCTFSWYPDGHGGFIIEESLLDFDAV